MSKTIKVMVVVAMMLVAVVQVATATVTVTQDDKDAVLANYCTAVFAIDAVLADTERARLTYWGMSVAERNPVTMRNLPMFWETVGATMSAEDKLKMTWWSIEQMTNHIENVVYLNELLKAIGAEVSDNDGRKMATALIESIDRADNVLGIVMALETLGVCLTDEDRIGLILKIRKRIEKCPVQMADFAEILRTIAPCFSNGEKKELIDWVEGQIENHPENFAFYSKILEEIGAELSDEERRKKTQWCERLVEKILAAQTINSTKASAVSVTITNVVIHNVMSNLPSKMAVVITNGVGLVNVITEIKGGKVAIPDSWGDNYPKFTEKFGDDFSAALTKETGKVDSGGSPMMVWQDFVAGTDPTDEESVFRASVTMVDGKPIVSYTPELTAEEKAKRKYTTLGKVKLQDAEWVEVQNGSESDYNFFKVTVEMK